MAKKKYSKSAWLAAHGTTGHRTKLERLPEVSALLKQMLLDCGDQRVVWSRVRNYIRQIHPEAPKHAQDYKRFAVDHLGWSEK